MPRSVDDERRGGEGGPEERPRGAAQHPARVQEVVVDGDVEMARGVVTGTLASDFAGVKGTGRSCEIDQAVIMHLRDRKIIEASEIADIAASRAQLAGERG